LIPNCTLPVAGQHSNCGYRVYQSQFRFSATTLTALFVTYIVVLAVPLLLLASLSDYGDRRRVMAAGLVACPRVGVDRS
jgi:MFS family permease